MRPSEMANVVSRTIIAIQRLPSEFRAQHAAAKERNAAEKQWKADLLFQQEALDKLIESRDLDISMVEATDALGYYIYHDKIGIIRAYQTYRSLLESGARLPRSKKRCAKFGRLLREKWKVETTEDKSLKGRRSDMFVLCICSILTLLSARLAWFAIEHIHYNDDEVGLIIVGSILTILFFVLSVLQVLRLMKSPR